MMSRPNDDLMESTMREIGKLRFKALENRLKMLSELTKTHEPRWAVFLYVYFGYKAKELKEK